jgi:very-short-patch-repair endonuclease
MKKCSVCNKDISHLHFNKKFCSENCKSKRLLKVCKNCKKEYRTDNKKSFFCSRDCSARYWAKDPEWLEKTKHHRISFFKTKAGKDHAEAHSKRMSKNNPMKNLKTVKKAIQTRKENGTLDSLKEVRWNGKDYTKSQLLINSFLKWELEVVIKTNKIIKNVPYFYRVDIGNSLNKWAIECDGFYHTTEKQKVLDLKKNKCLELLGWKVLRIKDKEIFFDTSNVLLKIEKFFGIKV